MPTTAPNITLNTVREALHGLIYTALPVPPSPLLRLKLLDEVLADGPGVLGADRGYALQRLLTAAVTKEWTRRCHCLGLTRPTLWETRAEAEVRLHQLATHAPKDTLCWAVVYYRYVKVDLNLSMADLARLLGVDRRSVQRYQNHAMQQLTYHLLEAEQAARFHQSVSSLSGSAGSR